MRAITVCKGPFDSNCLMCGWGNALVHPTFFGARQSLCCLHQLQSCSLLEEIWASQVAASSSGSRKRFEALSLQEDCWSMKDLNTAGTQESSSLKGTLRLKVPKKVNTIKRVILTASIFITFNVQYWRFQNQWRIETLSGKGCKEVWKDFALKAVTVGTWGCSMQCHL